MELHIEPNPPITCHFTAAFATRSFACHCVRGRQGDRDDCSRHADNVCCNAGGDYTAPSYAAAVTIVRGTDFSPLSIEIEEKDFAANVEQARVFLNTFTFLGG